MARTSDHIADAVRRHEYDYLPAGAINNKVRNKMIERERMSKTFTMDRRKEARSDFDSRMEFNLQKRRIKKKQLEKKFYDYDFKPKINKNRINIYSKNAPKVTVKARRKKTPSKSPGKFAKKDAPTRAVIKRQNAPRNKSDLGEDTHLKRINQSREVLQNLSNFATEKSETEDLGQVIGENLESIKYDYSVTNNNSFESIHQRLKGSEFGFQAKENQAGREEAADECARQPEIKFSGFSKSKSRYNKQNLKKSRTEVDQLPNQLGEMANQSLNNLKNNVDSMEVEVEMDDTPSQEMLVSQNQNVSRNRNGLNLLKKDDGRFVSNAMEKNTNQSESDTFFRLSTTEKVNSMKLNIKGHFSQKEQEL